MVGTAGVMKFRVEKTWKVKGEKMDIITKNVYNINNNKQKEKLLCQIKNKHKK